MKKTIALLTVGIVWTTLTGMGLGQQATGSEKTTNSPAPPMLRRQGEAIRPAINNRIQFLTQQLNLSEEQQRSIRTILEQEREKLQSVRTNTNLTPEQRRAKYQEIRNETNQKIKETLTPEQQAKFDQLSSQIRQGGNEQARQGTNQVPPRLQRRPRPPQQEGGTPSPNSLPGRRVGPPQERPGRGAQQ